MSKETPTQENERNARRAIARRRHQSVKRLYPIIFETHALRITTRDDSSDDDDAIEVNVETHPSYILRDDGIGVRLRTRVTRSDCELTVDLAMHYEWDNEQSWNDIDVSAFMWGFALPEAFGYQRPILDQMVTSLDLPSVTLTLNNFNEAAQANPA